MAEGGAIVPSEVCWYFAANKMCKQGDNCPYRHISINQPLICRYYLQNRCRFGRNCRFLHPVTHGDNCNANEDVAGAAAVASTSGLGAPVTCRFTKESVLCPHNLIGLCDLGDKCTDLHGNICQLCGKACLHPLDQEKRDQHNTECMKINEKEIPAAVARSKDKMCGICFEVIMEKNHKDQRFGILPNCNHCFCLSCIRTWRQSKEFESKITRACPECRTASDFVCPSMHWADTKEDKEKLITDYKNVLSKLDCKYFNKGQGKCHFGNKCFYSHVLPDGSHVDLGPPSHHNRRRNTSVNFEMLQNLMMWELFEEDGDLVYMDDTDDSSDFLSDSDFTDSDFSDSDLEFLV